MKGYTDFARGFLGPEAIATKPIDKMKYMDWEKVQTIIRENPDSVIYAGLMEDWNNTSGLIFARGKFYDGYVYGQSIWATPIVDVDGKEIECWTYDRPDSFTTGTPKWLSDGEPVFDECEFLDFD